MRVLAGDIGGTKTAVAIVEIGTRRLSILRSETYPSGQHGSLEEILVDFLAPTRQPPGVAGFGVAGPVSGGRSRVTKLPWTIDERALERATGIRRVRILNDFVAAALGIPYLAGSQLARLRAGKQVPGGPIALIGAGTGLGQAALVSVGGRYEPLASQGGHADFGPRDATEDRFTVFLRSQFGRASRDRILSGEGLRHLYDFLKQEGFASESRAVAAAFETEDRAAVISRFGLGTPEPDPLCAEALRLFVRIYGSESGNLAIQYVATGGLYVAGGIAAKILPALRRPEFLESFDDKPPMEDLLSRIPVWVVREPRLGLYGAAAAAYRTAMDTERPSSKSMTRPARR